IRRLVVCGLSETIATLPPQSALTSVDFPTFGRPATATKPLLTPPGRVFLTQLTIRSCPRISPFGFLRVWTFTYAVPLRIAWTAFGGSSFAPPAVRPHGAQSVT